MATHEILFPDDEIDQIIDNEDFSEGTIRRILMTLQHKFESDEICEDGYCTQEDLLINILETIREWKGKISEAGFAEA